MPFARRRVATLFALGTLAIALAACSGGPPPPTVPVPSGALVLRVVGNKFVPDQLTAQAGQPLTLYFDNADGVPHNVVILGSDDSRILAGEILTGPTQRIYELSGLAPTTYRLHCDVHPEMYGTITVP